ncbi:MAG: maleylpyruvate isomerase family mycothiol-dependent enzyme [Acidothermaceae bacterium]
MSEASDQATQSAAQPAAEQSAQHFDPASSSAEIAAATARLLDTARTLSDDDVLAPSVLPDWTRGHVLTHIARNADGLSNLLGGATAGEQRTAYPSRDARTADIEAGSRRPIKELIADIEGAHERFVAAVAAVPPSRWDFRQAWGSAGQTREASHLLEARLREVAIHHIDLDAGYSAADWSPEFALLILQSVLPAFESRGLAPCTLRPTDIDAVVDANGGSGLEVSGDAHALTTWLLGRDHGGSLKVTGGDLPTPPDWT